MSEIVKKINDFLWKYPRASIFILGIITGLLIAFIF
jgi:hypothetical protein